MQETGQVGKKQSAVATPNRVKPKEEEKLAFNVLIYSAAMSK